MKKVCFIALMLSLCFTSFSYADEVFAKVKLWKIVANVSEADASYKARVIKTDDENWMRWMTFSSKEALAIALTAQTSGQDVIVLFDNVDMSIKQIELVSE